MLRVALKSLLGHKLRLAITALAIALGVGFMAGTFVLTDTIAKSFDGIFEDAHSGIDAVVRGEAAFEASALQGGDARPDIDPAVADQVAAVDGVAFAAPDVFSQSVTVLDAAGDSILPTGAPHMGFNWMDLPGADGVLVLAEGRPPQGPTEAVIDRTTARQGKIALGDTVQVVGLRGARDMQVTGVARFGSSDNMVGAGFVVLDTPTALEMFTPDGQVQSISVVADDGISQEELVRRLTATLPDGLEAITADESAEEIQEIFNAFIDQLRILLNGFAGVALAAGAFLIYNTFGIIIAQRVRELALLRSLGSSRKQVLTSVLIESAAIGLVASLLGLVGGILLATGLKLLLGAVGFDLPGLAPVIALRTVVVSVVVGLVITLLSAMLPAWRASRVAPLAALREVATDGGGRSRLRLVIGLVLALPAAYLLLPRDDGEIGGALLGTVLAFTAVVILGPFIAPVVSAVLGYPLRLFGASGTLGRDNARRNPKRSAATASALMLAVTIVSLFAVFTFSAQKTINGMTDRYLLADLEVTGGGFGMGNLGPGLVDDLAARPEVAAVTGVQTGFMLVDDDVQTVFGLRVADVEEVFDLQGVEGDLAGLTTEQIAVDRATADDRGWTLGTEVAATFPDASTATLTVGAVYGNATIITQGGSGLLVADTVFKEHFPAAYQYLLRVDVTGADGVDLAALRTVVEDAASAFPTADVLDRQEIKDRDNRAINQSLALLMVLLLLAVVIGGLGITNTLALSVFERTREIGLLRAVGATRRQMAGAILGESLLLTLFGTLAGLAVGVVGGIAVMKTQGEVFTDLIISVPPVFVIAVLVFAVGLGVGASLLPGWRAARLNVLDAISHE